MDGPFEYQNETVKAGVRMLTPMLAVETVAAGGGSICGFDGHHLFVGPKSAGADPGPACYGRGGPLTITDVNVLLGRLVPSCFPFKLDVKAAQARLDSILSEVNGATGSKLTAIELAEGFQRIANEKMAAAIRQVSTSKGYDVREYALVSFGGAGGQHACAIADSLGIRAVVHSPFAGVLSAVGIGAAARTRIVERSVQIPWSEDGEVHLRNVVDELAAEAEGKLVEDGVDREAMSASECTLDLCYAGQASFITIPGDSWEALPARFTAAHHQLYGYAHVVRAIEIRAVRVKVESARGGNLTLNATPHSKTTDSDSLSSTSTGIAGVEKKTPLFHRSKLEPWTTIIGPAILAEETSTFIIDAGWSATVTDNGSVILLNKMRAEQSENQGTIMNPVQLELFRFRFSAIAERMGTTLRRTALSTNVKDRLDFSCAVFTADGELIANAPHIPVHLGGMSHCVKALMHDVGGFRPGDVYITNDPFRGGSHLNDVTVVTPVFGDRDELLFVVANRAHHAEIGGKRPGSMAPDSTSLAEEGVLIRAFKYMDRGQPQVDAFRKLLTDAPYPTRAPEENLADVAAQVAANETGAQDLRSLIASQSQTTVDAYVYYMRESAARQVRAAIARLPQGVRRFEDSLDDGTRICLALTIANETATFDFTGTSPVHRGNFNANVAIVTSAVLYCLRCLIDEEIPLNAGVLDAVRIVVPDCFLNPTPDADPLRCPAVGAGNVETSQRIVDTIFGALGVVAASQGTMNNLLMGNARFGYYETICGGSGAGPGFDGCDAVHTHMTNTRLTDVEILESRYPVRVARFGIRHGFGGLGKHHGGGGVIREIEFLEPLSVSIISQRRTRGPYGVDGGETGAPGRNTLQRCNSTTPEI
ncbi:MAG: hydantoinase B/oxoprolinase family protein, partial [Planctomycetaceae bacterium]